MTLDSPASPPPARSLWQRVLARLRSGAARVIDGPAPVPADDRQERRRQRERRFQSVMVSICTAGVVWVVQTLAAVDKRTEAQTLQIGYLQASSARAETLRNDVVEIRDGIHTLQGRIDGIERRVADMERLASPRAAVRRVGK